MPADLPEGTARFDCRGHIQGVLAFVPRPPSEAATDEA